jgi:hypothetical protein
MLWEGESVSSWVDLLEERVSHRDVCVMGDLKKIKLAALCECFPRFS